MQKKTLKSASAHIADADSMIDEITETLRATAREVVPDFVERMPVVYFQDTDRATQLSHLRAIIAARASGRSLELSLGTEDGSEVTYIRPSDYPGVLAEVVRELPLDRSIRAAKIHTATDGSLVVDTFVFGESDRYNGDDREQARKLEQTIKYAAKHLPDWSATDIAEYFDRCRADYILTLTPLRICHQWEHFKRVSGTDGTAVSLEREFDPKQSRIVVASCNSRTRVMLERIAHRLSRSSINIHRAYLDIVDDGENGRVNFLGFVVQGPDGGPIDPKSELWESVHKDLLRLKWLDQRTLDLAYRLGEDLTRTEMLIALCHLSHQVLVKEDRHAFDRDRIVKLVERNHQTAFRVVDLFMERFDPSDPMGDDEMASRMEAMRDEIEGDVDLEDARLIFSKLLEAVASVLATNVYLTDRYALSMRLDPTFLASEERSEDPYGVFFVHGRSFCGFHVRFRDIARGGIRAIRTIGADQHSREIERLYDEAYGLAFAQQLKNKDIPEGGSKAVVLLEPATPVDRCVKAFVDSLLDLITPDERTRRFIVDRREREEMLYLGPDENITPELIDWIVARAKRRGYPTPTALMSSKPGAGINHKTYGVTSEGVTVFLDVALRHKLNIDPTTDRFTVKITGGPDGDVAGNEIKILHRDYGQNAVIVGIADGSGVGEDPNGLDHDELLRLVEHALPIAEFDPSKLSKDGRVVRVEEPDGVQLRNTLHNRLIADAFVPAGGRPATIHSGNYEDFLDKNGKPSSLVIVEGANLFLTPEARVELSHAGVLIVKDSSANKCGVICSSFEVIACMLLSEEEFLEIKEVFVGQILEKLRSLARREAELLMRVMTNHPTTPLPEMSARISNAIIKISDAMESTLHDLGPEDAKLVKELVVEHLPAVLVERVGERIWTDTPTTYLRWIMAKSLAARIVYREGYESVECMSTDKMGELALDYLRQESERRRLSAEIMGSDLPHRERIARLLDRSGILPTLGDD